MKIGKLIVVGMIALISTVNCYASEITVGSGWLHTANSNYGDSYDLVARVEQEAYRGIGIGIEYEYHGPMNHGAESGESYGDLSGHSVMLDIIYTYPIHTLKPYIFAGVGYSFWDWERSQAMVDRGIFVDVGDCFIYKVGLGVKKQLTKYTALGIEWSYSQCDIPKSAHYADGSFSNILDTGSTLGEGETRVVATFSYTV